MKKILAISLGVVLVLFAPAVVPFAGAQETAKKIVRANGAAVSSDQVNIWAQRFNEANPDVSVTVVGSSAGKGFQSLVDGATEISMMSRAISPAERKKAEEKGLQLVEKPIGHAGIAVVTHSRNPVNELTFEQLRKLYTGEYDNWNKVGGPDEPVRCLTRRIPESGGAVFFWEEVVGKEPFGSKTVFTETWDAIIKVCSSAQDLPIGIVPATRNLSGVKVLGVKKDDHSRAVLPKEEEIRTQVYPIVLAFSFVWDARSKESAIVKFVDFCQSRGGGK
jgi:phosphate transport system substrate-binding protein